MDKSKRKGKLNRRRLIILMVMVLFSGCILASVLLLNSIPNPHHQAPILSDIEVGAESLLEARLLEYISIGESTRAEVEAFGDEYLAFTDYSCVSDNTISESCYRVNVPSPFCSDYHLQISFIFTDDTLSDIDYVYQGFACL